MVTLKTSQLDWHNGDADAMKEKAFRDLTLSRVNDDKIKFQIWTDL